MSDAPPKEPPIGRRRFLKYAVLGGAAAAAAGVGAGYLGGLFRARPRQPPPWEVAPGVVDYDRVPIPARGDTVTLRIAQWFDYWPGAFLANSAWSFADFMQSAHGIRVEYQLEYFTSMEELFLWVSPLQQKAFDVFVPSNEMASLFDRAGWLYNLNEDWLPNLMHLDDRLLGQPTWDPWDRRSSGDLRAVPYFWGTTGIGFRTDVLDRADVEAFGWDVFWQPTYQGTTLRGRMNMLNEMRDVIGLGFKKAGWESQVDLGMTPSGELPPLGVQWTTNETDPSKVDAARLELLQAKPNLFDFNTTSVIPSLQTGASWVNHAWSGDAILAEVPDAASPFPVDYVIPKQGTRWWIDAMSIHSQATNLWVAHQFLNFVHEPDVYKNLGLWNRYSCTNLTARSLMPLLGPQQWDIANDPRLYPSDADFRRLDLALDIGVENLNRLYVPVWDELKFQA